MTVRAAGRRPPRSAPGPGFVVQLDAFSGPLDLLLHLLREEQLEIADIPIARIADQFLQAIHELGLNQAADYLDMASRLVRLKAQMLLPRRSEEDGWEDPARRAGAAAARVPADPGDRASGWAAPPSGGRSSSPAATCRRRPSCRRRRSRSTCSSCCRRSSGSIAAIPSPVLHRVVARPLDVEGATRRIEQLLDGARASSAGSRRSGPRPTIVDVLSTLLALLELAKRGALRLVQPAAFAPMVIARDPARPAA